jgi:hypothetical protein
MRKILRSSAHGPLILAALGMMLGTARADAVRIDDLLDGNPIVTADNSASLVILGIGSEFVHFTFQEPVAAAATTTNYRDFLDPGGAVSDRVIFAATAGSALLDVQFASDPFLLPIPPNGINLGPLVEDGTFQLAFTYNNVTAPNTDYFVRSDVLEGGDVPEPSSLALLGLGGLALAWALRRKRQMRVLS